MSEVSRTRFEQATIPVQKSAEFEQLKNSIERLFAPPRVQRFLQHLNKAHVPVRHFESALAGGYFERVDEELARSPRTARQLYESLALSDQSLIREFYLVRLEQVDDSLRSRYREIYYCH